MSITGTHHAFVGIHEDGLNTLLATFKAARPWYFSYGTSMLGGGAPPTPVTLLSPIDIPNTPGGFHYRFDINKIGIDCYPKESTSALPTELTPLANNEFSLRVDLELTVLCPGQIIQDKYVKEWRTITADLILWAVGSPVSSTTADGRSRLGFIIRGVEIVDIRPDGLESILECFMKTVLSQAVLPLLSFMLDKLSTDFFSLALAEGPRVDRNQIFALGDLL